MLLLALYFLILYFNSCLYVLNTANPFKLTYTKIVVKPVNIHAILSVNIKTET